MDGWTRGQTLDVQGWKSLQERQGMSTESQRWQRRREEDTEMQRSRGRGRPPPAGRRRVHPDGGTGGRGEWAARERRDGQTGRTDGTSRVPGGRCRTQAREGGADRVPKDHSRPRPLLFNGGTVCSLLPTAGSCGHCQRRGRPGGVDARQERGAALPPARWTEGTRDPPATSGQKLWFCFQVSVLKEAAQIRARAAS